MGAVPKPELDLYKRIKDLEDAVGKLRNASPFFGTGMRPNGAGGIDSDNFEAGVAGYSFGADGDAEFNELTLRKGIIGDDALTNPLAPKVAHSHRENFTIPPGPNQVRVAATVDVPAGFTRALVMAVCSTSGYNDTPDTDYLYCVARIENDTQRGMALPVTVEPNFSGVTTHAATALLTDLTGSFEVQGACASAYSTWNTTLTGGTTINIDATILFLR